MSSETFREQFEQLEIPANIDPVLLSLWLEREREEIEKQENKKKKYTPPYYGRKLNVISAAVIGIGAMCLSVILGLIRCQEPNAILTSTCFVFLFYTAGGFVFGTILEYCVNDSAETLLREIVKRTDRNIEEHPVENLESTAEVAEG
jgi:hypothetical protein